MWSLRLCATALPIETSFRLRPTEERCKNDPVDGVEESAPATVGMFSILDAGRSGPRHVGTDHTNSAPDVINVIGAGPI